MYLRENCRWLPLYRDNLITHWNYQWHMVDAPGLDVPTPCLSGVPFGELLRDNMQIVVNCWFPRDEKEDCK